MGKASPIGKEIPPLHHTPPQFYEPLASKLLSTMVVIIRHFDSGRMGGVSVCLVHEDAYGGLHGESPKKQIK